MVRGATMIWFGWAASGCADPAPAVTGLAGAKAEALGDSGLPTDPDAGDGSGPDALGPAIPMTRDGMVGHLEALMAIAEAHGGNRATGTEGYTASVAYVTEQLEAAGYGVALYEFGVDDDVWNASPALQADRDFALEDEFYPFSYTGPGVVEAPVAPVDLQIPPPDAENGSTSGCESGDFADFTSGSIALIQRGSCEFQTKVDNAVAAGAVGVLIFNEGQPGRRDVFFGTLDEAAENAVPVFALSYDAGAALAALDPTELVTMTADFSRVSVPSVNVIAETGGDPDRAVVVGAHLDSVAAGPGINDNGSGVAMVLEMATQVAASDWAPTNQLRFVFWGAEELGLVGSIDYVMSLSEADHGRILANLNFDMVASPNPARMVYDGSGSLGGDGGPNGSGRIEQVFADWFNAQGLVFQETPFDGRSDYGPFIWTGIPAGGLFTGAEALKTPGEADAFGGTALQAFDPCYHQGCDTIDNLDLDVLDELAGASMHSVVQLGSWDGPLSDGVAGPPVGARERERVQRDWVPSSCGAGPRVWRR